MYQNNDIYVHNINIPNFFIIGKKDFIAERQQTLYHIIMVYAGPRIVYIWKSDTELDMLIKINKYHKAKDEEIKKCLEYCTVLTAKKLLLEM